MSEGLLETSQRLHGLLAGAVEARKPAARKWPTPNAMAVDLRLPKANKTTAALDLIGCALVELVDGDGDRLAVYMAPQEGKSQLVSRAFPLWLLEQDPTLRIGIVSYQAGKAERWGREIKRDIDAHPELGIRLRTDSRAAGRWETLQGGGVICAGIEGGITGEPIDVLVIDDPVRGRAQAESVTYRARAWDWWESNGSTRLSERGIVVLMNTRWHTDDLSGRIAVKEPGRWTVLSIPAIATSAEDPLGRKVGEELVSVRGRKAGYFHNLQLLRSSYVFDSLYQQHPTSAAGNIFKREDWRFWHQGQPEWITLEGLNDFRLDDCTRFITIDLASSIRTTADFTVACGWAIVPSGDLVLLDRIRDRVPEVDHAAFIAPLRQRWLSTYDVTYIESRMFGTTLVYALGRANVPVAELQADADKLTRALPYAGMVRQHRIWLPAGAPWLDEWLDEHADFPLGAHDDQVDCGAYAARVAIAHWVPMQNTSITQFDHRYRDPGEIALDQLFGPGDIDLMSAPW